MPDSVGLLGQCNKLRAVLIEGVEYLCTSQKSSHWSPVLTVLKHASNENVSTHRLQLPLTNTCWECSYFQSYGPSQVPKIHGRGFQSLGVPNMSRTNGSSHSLPCLR